MRSRLLTYLILPALLLGLAVPTAGTMFCEVRKGDCCACGPSMEAATCCCHQELTQSSRPESSTPTSSDQLTGVLAPAAGAIEAPALVAGHCPASEAFAPAASIVPLYLRHAAFLI